MLWLFRFIGGFLKIRLSGDFAEQIINSAARHKLSLWGLRYKKQAITGCISVKDFKALPQIHKGTGVRIKILEKHGLPFWVHRYRNRFGLLAGAVIFFLLLELLSSFIWGIEIEGNTAVAKSEIIADCKEIGIYEGILKNKITPKDDAQELLLISPGLAWASLNIEGCTLTVNVTEVKNPINPEASVPCNLIANADGIVKKIDITSGNAVVKVGDVVSKGDVLVSGIIESMSSTVFVPSAGTVTAEIYKNVSAQGEFCETAEIRTGKSTSRTVLEVFGIKIPLYLGKIKESCETEYKSETAYISGKRLPYKAHTRTFYFTREKEIAYADEGLKEKLRGDIKAQLAAEDYDEYTVKNEKIIPTEKGMILNQEVVTQANIAEVKKITVN